MKVETSLIYLDEIIELTRLCILSGKVKNKENPVSAILIGGSETGKSEMINIFRDLDNTMIANDLSGRMIIDHIAPKVLNEGKTHILIPDFIKVLSHGKKVTQNCITMLNIATQEGLDNIVFYGLQKQFPKIVKFGVITAVTKEAYYVRKRYWEKIGFISRLMPISYEYSEATKRRIHEHIARGSPKHIIELSKKRPRKIEIPEIYANQIKAVSVAKSPFSTGFRLHKQLRVIAQTNALLNDRNVVNKEDIDKLLDYTKYIGTVFYEI